MSIRGVIALFCALIFVSLPPPALAADKEPPKPVAMKEAALAYISVTGASGDGGVSQTKLVRKGSLDKKWGAAADAAARAAANAIVKLLPPLSPTAPKAP